MSAQVKTLPTARKVTQTHTEKKGITELYWSLDSIWLKFAHCLGNRACKFGHGFWDLPLHWLKVSRSFVFHLLVDDYVLVAKDKHGYNVEQVHSQAVNKVHNLRVELRLP